MATRGLGVGAKGVRKRKMRAGGEADFPLKNRKQVRMVSTQILETGCIGLLKDIKSIAIYYVPTLC